MPATPWFDFGLDGFGHFRAWRDYLNLTQEEVAERAGLSQPALARIEKPDTNPRHSTLKKLAEAMDLSVEQLSD